VHRKGAAGLAVVHPGLQDRILLNYTRIENVYKSARKLSIFVMYRSSANFLFSFFPAEPICLNPSMLKSAVFELVQQFYHATESGNVANPVSACADQDNYFG